MNSLIRSSHYKWLQCFVLMLSAIIGVNAWGQNFPNKPIQLIVPLSSGSITDNIARMVTVRLAERLKQPVIIENKTGAGGIVALRALQAARPDGYTLDDNMCSKQVTHENKEYTITVRPDKSCDINELRIGNMCVTQANQYFEQR